jgi:DNA-binding MarR family transcriptional regulator
LEAAVTDGHDLGTLAGQVMFAVQNEHFDRLHRAGYPDVGPRHGAVLAYLTPEGVRATELARKCGQLKQVVGHIVDDLERLGYVTRKPDPEDRRAKLVVPTAKGRRLLRASQAILADITHRHAALLGEAEYTKFLDNLQAVADHQLEITGEQ